MSIFTQKLSILAAATALIAGFTTGSLTGGSDHAGAWTWPVVDRPPQVIRGFEPPAHAWGEGHRGVDLAGAEGDAVLAAGSGTVTYAGWLAGVPIVVVSHGPVRTTYQPVTASVSVGERVAVGQELGRLSSIGSHCSPLACLHWGLLHGDTYLDPLSVIGTAGGPRLLPLGSRALQGANAMPAGPASHDHGHHGPVSAAAGLGAATGAGS